MGYTHYWLQRRDIRLGEWLPLAADVKLVLLNQEVPLVRAWGEGEPAHVGMDKIAFNGVGDEAHEDFELFRRRPPRPEYLGRAKPGHGGTPDFCKTDRKPYDTVVCAVLLLAAAHGGGAIEISSDGWRDEWEPAALLIERVLPDMGARCRREMHALDERPVPAALAG